jgi:protein-L-isoaspartate(D-aspartate) O-methyltransferase
MKLIHLILPLPFLAACNSGPEKIASPDTWSIMRERMVRTQIERRGVTNTAVLAALRAVPRHEFVPLIHQAHSYEDHPMPIGYDQTISQPYIVAAMTAALNLSPEDNVLEIGTGSGYQAAVLAEIVRTVYSIEIVKELAQRAERDLTRLGYTNVVVRYGDGYAGWKEHAPFDAIIVTCAPDAIPQPLIDQLAEGGRIVMPVGGRFGQQLIRVTKKNGKLSSEHLMGVIFVPMTGKALE